MGLDLTVILDLNKAFDAINSLLIIQCMVLLKHYGIRGLYLVWFKRYLSNRKQFLEYNKIEYKI